jgi:hypothetical protein
MIHKTDIARMAKKVFHHERGVRDPHIMHPEREWLIGLCLMIVIFAICATWSAQVYLKNKNISADQSAANHTSDSVYREPQVKEALQIASKRERELQDLLGVTPTKPSVEETVVVEVASTTEDVVEEEPALDETQASTTERGE